MTSRTLLNSTLALVLAGLITLAVFEPGSNEVSTAATLTQLTAENVQKIQVQSPRQPNIDLQKIDGHWEMLTPYSAPANQERITQLLKVTNAKILATYNVDITDTKQLQLDSPLMTLTLDATRLDFGGTTPLGGSRYIRIDKSIHLITDRYSHLARGSATDLVSPILLNTTNQITGLQLPTLNLMLVDGRWQIENQQALKNINPDHLQQLLDQWRHARAFNVQAIDTTFKDSDTQHPETIIVTTINSSLHFTLRRTDDEIILQRRDLGLQYHFSQEVGQRLLTLPQLNDA